MSEVSQSEMSTAGGEAPGGQGGSKAPMIVVGAVLLLLVAGLVFFITSGESAADPSEANEGGGSTGGGSSGGGTSGGSSSSSSGSGSGSGPPTPPRSYVTLPPPPPPPKSLMKLTCTYGDTGVLPNQLPPDRMCDYTFYTHVHYDTKDKKIHPKYGKTAYQVFKKGSSSYQTTTFGVSMKSGILPSVIANNKQGLTDALRDMMKNNIMHFGMLEVDVRDYAAASQHMEFLKVAGDVLKGKADHHCALGIFNATDGGTLIDTAKKAARDFPSVTMLILKIHHYKSSDPDKLFPIAPNPVGGDLQKYDVTTFNDIKDKLDDLADVAEKGHYLMISMAMYALAYRVPNYQQTLTLATSSVALDYGVVCACSSSAMCSRDKDPNDQSSTLDDRNKKTIDMFDTGDQIEKKVQDRLDVLPKNFSGIAAYNVEMDDFDQSCLESQDNGRAFYRLNLIRKKVNVAMEHVVANVPTS